MLNRINGVLLVLLVATVGAVAFTRVDTSRPNVEILPDMKYSPAYSAFAPNPQFANGRTLQAPVAGTIARGQLPLHYSATKEDAVRAGAELRNPYRPPADGDAESQVPQAQDRLQASVARGGQGFATYCVACHGAAGAGDGPVSQRGFPPPPSLVTGNSRNMQDGQLWHIITFGQGNMPAMGTQIPRDRRWDLVNYLRTLQRPVTSISPPQPPQPRQPGNS